MPSESQNMSDFLSLELAHNLSHILCPSLQNDVDTYIDWLFDNEVSFNTSLEVARYSCMKIQLRHSTVSDLGDTLAILRIIGGSLGFIGSILALITFSSSEYEQCVTMTYHRFTNAVELVNALILIQGGINTLCEFLSRHEIWVFFSVVILRFSGPLLLMVNMIILVVTGERIAACFSNRIFNKMNRNRFARAAVVSMTIMAIVIALPNGFGIDYIYRNSTDTYVQKESDISETPTFESYVVFYAVFTLIHSFLLLVASVIAASGFLSVARRKHNLAKESPNHQLSSDNELLKQYSRSLQLCVLQLCEAVPVTIHEIILAAYLIQYEYIVEVMPNLTAPKTVSVICAVDEAKETEAYYVLQFVVNFGVVLSHCFRFYFYMLFSTKARRSFTVVVGRVLRLPGKSTPQQEPVKLFVASARTPPEAKPGTITAAPRGTL